MLKALYDYAMKNNLVLPPGYSNKTIKAYVSLSKKGEFLGIILGMIHLFYVRILEVLQMEKRNVTQL